MSGIVQNLSGYQRWQRNVNPGGSMDQYQTFLSKHRKSVVHAPVLVSLPDGCIVPAANLSRADIATMNSSYVKESASQQ